MMKCEKCGTKLKSLYFRKYGKKSNWIRIEEVYCEKCKKPMLVTNWFEGE